MKNITIDKWRKLALSLAIVIVLNVFFNVGVETFVNPPDVNDYCDFSYREYQTEESCDKVGGDWYENTAEEQELYGEAGFCEYDCWGDWDDAKAPFDRDAFIILTILGTVTVILGLYLVVPLAVTNGLLYGGVLSILIGVMRYWPHMDDYFQFIVSGVALFFLILVGIKKVKD